MQSYLDVVRYDSEQVDDTEKRCRHVVSTLESDSQIMHSHPTHCASVLQDMLHATHRAIYSMVKSATKLVSSPNHVPLDISWKAGTVSSIVTRAEIRMRPVENICTTKAAEEDVGCSNKAKSSRFHAGARALADVLMGSFSPEALRILGPSEKISRISVGESGGGCCCSCKK